MPKRPTKSPSSIADKPDLELCRRHPLRPIRDDADLHEATALIHTLLDQGSLTPDEEHYLDALGNLVEKYESEHLPTPQVSDSEMLRFLMDSQGINPAQLALAAGIAESTVSEILSGKRTLTRRHIEALAPVFHVNTTVFLHSAR